MRRFHWVILIASLAAVAVAGSAMAGTSARAAATCKAPKYPGAGYFTSLKVKSVSCATGRKVTLAHYRCRTKSSRSGRCHSKVLNYKCTEVRNSIPTEIDGRVTCKRGSRSVIYTYQQDL